MTEQKSSKYPVVILSNISYDFLWQRQQIIATHFARAGHRVIFVEGLAFGANYLDPAYYKRAASKLWRNTWPTASKGTRRKLPRSLTVYSALVAPLKPRMLRRLNKRVLVPRVLREIAGMGIQNPVVWSFQPTETAMQLARGLKPRALVYDCVVNFAPMPDMPPDISKTELQWLQAADLVLVDSLFMRHKHAVQRPDLIQVPPGVDYELFSQAYSNTRPDKAIQRVCFFGGMNSVWFDFDLIESVADAGFSVFLVGYRAERHRIFDHPNVDYTPPVAHARLPALLKPMDALLLPYKLNEFTKGVFPAKLYESLATGKPIVATPLSDLQAEFCKYIYLASDGDEFVSMLRRMPEVETQERVQSRLALAWRNRWESRFDSIFRELERLPHV